MNTMINFQNKGRKNSSLGKDKISHNIGVKPSSFDRLIQDLNLLDGLYKYDVVGKDNTQHTINYKETINTKENINHCT